MNAPLAIVIALGVIAQPGDPPRLRSYAELRMRMLRDPAMRAQAIQAMDAPDLRQLLHMATGDNCPVCRMRGAMAREQP